MTWNDEEFFVAYQSLKAELKVGRCPLQLSRAVFVHTSLFRTAIPSRAENALFHRYYVRFLLDEKMSMEAVQGPQKLLGQLYHRFLTEPDPPVQVMCLRAMARVYQHYNQQPFDRYALASLIRLLQQPSSPWSLSADGASRRRGPDGAPPTQGAQGGTGPGLHDGVTAALLSFLAVAIRNDSNAQTVLLSCDLIPLLVRLAASANRQRRCVGAPQSPAACRTVSHDAEQACAAEQGQVQSRDKEAPQAALSQDSSALALDLLETLVSKKKTVSDSGALLRPLPLAIRLVTSPELLPHLLPLLLAPRMLVVSAVVRILEISLKNAPPNVLMSSLSFGAVPMLLLSLLYLRENSEQAAAIARLLQQIYLSTAASASHETHPPGRGRAVQDWLPEGMRLVLGRDEAWLGRFVEALYWGFEEAECRPWIVWSEEMRHRLHSALLKLMDPFLEGLTSDPLAHFQYPEHVLLPDYSEALEACWLGLTAGNTQNDDSINSRCQSQSASLEMGYYLDSLARHAVGGRGLAIAAGDAQRLSAHIAERLQAPDALEPQRLPQTVKLLQVCSALVLQHTVQPYPLEPLLRRILARCRHGRQPPPSGACVQATCDVEMTATESGDRLDCRGSDRPTSTETVDQIPDTGWGLATGAGKGKGLGGRRGPAEAYLAEALRWGLCAMATGGLFGGDVRAEVSLILSVLAWNSECAQAAKASRELIPWQMANVSQIRAWALNCAASLLRWTAQARQVLDYLASLDEDGKRVQERLRLKIVEEIEAAMVDNDAEEISAACSCITACCSSITSLTLPEHLHDNYYIGVCLIESHVPLLLIESILQCGDGRVTDSRQAPGEVDSLGRPRPSEAGDSGVSPQRLTPATHTLVWAASDSHHGASAAMPVRQVNDGDKLKNLKQDSVCPRHPDGDSMPPGTFSLAENTSPYTLEILYKNALSKVEALAAVAREACRRSEAAADELGTMLRALLTAPLYQRLLEGDARHWLNLFFGEQRSADLVWGSENRRYLLRTLTALITKKFRCADSGGSAARGVVSDSLQTFRYDNLACLTPVAGIYLELLPLESVPDLAAGLPMYLNESDLVVVAADEVKDVRLVPAGWPVADLDVFVGNVFDLVAHGLDDSAPTSSQASAALDVLLRLAVHSALLKAKYRCAGATETLGVDVISSLSRAELVVSLLQLSRDDSCSRLISLQALRLLAAATMSPNTAALCLNCTCRRAPVVAGLPASPRLLPLDLLIARGIVCSFAIRTGSLALDDPDRLLYMLHFVLHLLVPVEGRKLLAVLPHHGVVEASVLAILVLACDESSMTSPGPPPPHLSAVPMPRAAAPASPGAAGTAGRRKECIDARALRLCDLAASLVETLIRPATHERRPLDGRVTCLKDEGHGQGAADADVPNGIEGRAALRRDSQCSCGDTCAGDAGSAVASAGGAASQARHLPAAHQRGVGGGAAEPQSCAGSAERRVAPGWQSGPEAAPEAAAAVGHTANGASVSASAGSADRREPAGPPQEPNGGPDWRGLVPQAAAGGTSPPRQGADGAGVARLAQALQEVEEKEYGGPGLDRLRACLPGWMVEQVCGGRRLADCLLQDRQLAGDAETGSTRPDWNASSRRKLWWHLVDLVGASQRALADRSRSENSAGDEGMG